MAPNSSHMLLVRASRARAACSFSSAHSGLQTELELHSSSSDMVSDLPWMCDRFGEQDIEERSGGHH